MKPIVVGPQHNLKESPLGEIPRSFDKTQILCKHINTRKIFEQNEKEVARNIILDTLHGVDQTFLHPDDYDWGLLTIVWWYTPGGKLIKEQADQAVREWIGDAYFKFMTFKDEQEFHEHVRPYIYCLEQALKYWGRDLQAISLRKNLRNMRPEFSKFYEDPINPRLKS